MYTLSSKVRYSECDEDQTLTVAALINYLQDCSTFHTESIGHGIAHTTSLGFAWFIMAWHIEIRALPRFCDPIAVNTWVHSMRPTSSGRCFTVTDGHGEDLVLADSLWVAYNLEQGRPMRIPQSEQALLSGDEALDLGLRRKVSLTGEGTALPGISITEEHLDSNHHVNNGRYVAMAENALRWHDEAFVPRLIRVQYKTPALLGDTVVPHLHTLEDGYGIDLSNPDGTSFATVSLTS